MTDDMVWLENEEVVVKHIATAKVINEPEQHIDESYHLLLSDIVKVIDNHPSLHGSFKQYLLCPRWDVKLPSRRDVNVYSKPQMFALGEKIGTVRITNDSDTNRITKRDKHSLEMQFRLSFHPEEGKHFITSGEFCELYQETS